MIEQVFQLAKKNEKVIERVIADEHVNYNHMILPKGEGLPEHFSNANVYMLVITGELSIALDHGETRSYEAGSLLKIPEGIHMNVKNLKDEILELTVVKVPAP